MLRTTAPDCWSAGIGGSGEWRGPPATGEARETVDYSSPRRTESTRAAA